MPIVKLFGGPAAISTTRASSLHSLLHQACTAYSKRPFLELLYRRSDNGLSARYQLSYAGAIALSSTIGSRVYQMVKVAGDLEHHAGAYPVIALELHVPAHIVLTE